MDKVSILIPVYNREKYIKETVESALNQTYQNIEVIIVDNLSTDNTWDILQKLDKLDRRVKIFQNSENLGPVKNWSRCFSEASGKYAKILWSDDKIAPDFIEKTLPFLSSDTNVGFVFTRTKIFNNTGGVNDNIYSIGKSGVYPRNKYISGVLLSYHFPVSPGCALFRLSDLIDSLVLDVPNKVGAKSSMHGIGSDLLLFLMVLNKYNKFAFVDESLSLFRDHSDSISSSEDKTKLILYYNLAKSYYVENFRKELIGELNSRIYLDLFRYDGSRYDLNSIGDFYASNKNFHWSVKAFLKVAYYKIKSRF